MTNINLPPLTHYITVNSNNGISSLQKPADTPKVQRLGPNMQVAYLYSSPASFNIQKDTDLTYHQAAPSTPPFRSFPPAGATAAVIADIGPNPNDEPGSLHRTQTLDYVVILEGEMELSLDGGEKVIVKRGEMVVQRAAMHAWRNISKTESARMLAVAVGNEGAIEGAVEWGQGEKQLDKQ
jgi:mannose-6-phosphate isomerase-like protein (cupin superfamily)